MTSTYEVDNISNNTSISDQNNLSKKIVFDLSNISPNTTRTLTIPDANINLLGETSSQTITNKTINADNNTLLNIVNSNINTSAAIDATKIADGSVSNTTFQYLSGLSSTAIGVSDSQSMTNKTFTDTSTYFENNLDNTKKMQLDLSNINTDTTIIITLPNGSFTVVGENTTQILYNKTLTNPSISTINNGGTITVPSGTDTLVSRSANETLSNKNIQANNIDVDNLNLNTNTISSTNISGNINILPDGNGEVIVKADPISDLGIATKQYVDNLTADTSIVYSQVNASNVITTTSNSYQLIDKMDTIPTAGTYFVSFSASYDATDSTSSIKFALYLNNSINNASERLVGYQDISNNTEYRVSIHCQGILTTNGTDIISAKVKTSTGTLTIYNRNMILIKL